MRSASQVSTSRSPALNRGRRMAPRVKEKMSATSFGGHAEAAALSRSTLTSISRLIAGRIAVGRGDVLNAVDRLQHPRLASSA